ncbi:MAG: hypothetical protein WCI97_04980 [Bacteroidota bacterium]
MKKIFFLASLAINVNAFSQTYIPENAISKETALVVFNYSNTKEANRPSAEVKFSDGFEFYLNTVCEGEYCWCIRNSENKDIAYMKLAFEQKMEIMKIVIKENEDSNAYLKYLNLLNGFFKKVE